MTSNHLQTTRENAYRDSIETWSSGERRAALGITEEEAAYSALEHAALWLRAQADAGIPDELNAMALEERVRLVRAACRSASGIALPPQCERLLAKDLLESEDIEEFEHVLMQIDGLDAVVDLAARLVEPALDDDQDLLSELARMRCIVANLVQQLSERLDILAVASRHVLGQRNVRFLDDGRPADWFTRLREWDRELSSADLSDLLGVRQTDGGEQSSTERHRPKALRMLDDRINEIASRSTQAAIAASAGEVGGHARIKKRSEIADEPNVHVMLEWKPADETQGELIIVLVGGPMEDKMKYLAAELCFRSRTPERVELQRGRGMVQLQGDETLALDSIALLDDSGNRREVNLD